MTLSSRRYMLSTAVHFPGTPWSKNLALGQDGDGEAL